MVIWQADFYKGATFDAQAEIFWELLICDSLGQIIYQAKCPQSQASTDWLMIHLQRATEQFSPDLIQVFRPQSLGLLTSAAQKLGITVVPTRRTKALKLLLQQRLSGRTHNIEKLPPQPLPENLWGEKWSFVSLNAGDLIDFFKDRPIPILNTPEELLPINLGLASTLPISGLVIYGGKKSIYLARWLEEQQPVAINYIPTEMGQSGGLVLESGLVDRWIIATFEDSEVAAAAARYEQRKQISGGLHFLVVQPDDSGMAYTGFWLLQPE